MILDMMSLGALTQICAVVDSNYVNLLSFMCMKYNSISVLTTYGHPLGH
jgi:hypothetical protein